MITRSSCILLLFALAFSGCDSPGNVQLTSGEPPASQGDGGVARLHFDLGPVGVVAGRSMDAAWRRILIRFEEIREDGAPGRYRHDTLLFRSGQALSQEYRFDPGTRWTVFASVVDRFQTQTFYRGQAEFVVDPHRTIEVPLQMDALFAVGKFLVPVVDSMTRFVMMVNHDIKVDHSVAKQEQIGQILELDATDIPASPGGSVNYLQIFVEGEMWGRTFTLYRMTDTIRIFSGQSVSLRLGLTWVGPTAPPPGGANLQMRFEDPIAFSGEIYYRDTTGARCGTSDFVDFRSGETYPYKRIGNQTWMLRNIGATCFDALDSNLYSYGDCKYGTLFTDTAAAIDTNLLSYDPIPNKDYRSACPTGWHVPDTSEWHELVRYAANGETDSVGAYRLRTREGWYGRHPALGIPDAKVAFNGSDEFGFALHPSQLYKNGYPGFRWDEAQMFTSTPGCRVVIFDNHGYKGCSDFHFEKFYPSNTYAASVRCIKDSP